MKPKVLAAIVWGAIALWVLVANADFGSFRMDQPFLARGASGPCAGTTFPIDTLQTYTALELVNGLNGGCLWNGAYVVKGYESYPAVWMQDAYDYDTNTTLNTLAGGVSWYTEYVVHAYYSYSWLSYVDAMDEYATNSSMITNVLSGGTNYIVTFGTVAQAWTNGPYVGKGY